MSIQDTEALNKSILAVCKLHSRARDVIKMANGSNDYRHIAKTLKIRPDRCSTILNQAFNLGLLEKLKPGLFKKKKSISLGLIDQALKNNTGNAPVERKVRVKRKQKKIHTGHIKKDLKTYFLGNFTRIDHPFSKMISIDVSREDINKSADKLFEIIETETGINQLRGLPMRFYESSAAFFSAHRINKPEVVNAFSNLIKCYEPFFKQVAVIKESNPKNAHLPLNQDLIKKVVPFCSAIKESNDSYWVDKPIHEAAIRLVYPSRHKEAHEARDYQVHEMEKIVYYFFASILLLNLNPR